jgi:signal transduction histidine kinase
MADARCGETKLPPQAWAPGLSDVWDTGLVVLGFDGRLDFANAKARALLNVSADDELEPRWLHVKRQIEPTLEAVRAAGHAAPVVVHAATMGAPHQDLHLQVHLVDQPGGMGLLLLLQHARRAAAVERWLGHAARSRSFMSLARDTAHELKDRLNVISMNAELLARAAASSGGAAVEDRQGKRSAEVIQRELRRLDRAIDALFDRHMMERESPQTFDVVVLCEAVLRLIAARASRQRVEVRSMMRAGTTETVGFPDRLHGALLSLMVNALDAMPDGGTLHLAVTKTTTIRICLCDTGPGILRDRLADIWGLPFTTKAQATGLGLHVTRSAVEAHGGTINYHPNPSGGGSCFVIELPAAGHGLTRCHTHSSSTTTSTR